MTMTDPLLLNVSPAHPVWAVEQTIDHDTYAIQVTPPRAHLIEQLAAAAHDDDGIRAELLIAIRSAGGARRTMACRAIEDLLEERLTDRMVLQVEPGDADGLADRIADAAREPAWCTRCGHAYARFGDHCPGCSADDDDRQARAV